MVFPSRFRNVLESFVEDLKLREVVSGIGLFGSWSRGDASPASDVDFLIVENRSYDYEYFERINLDGCLVDLNYVSRSWIAYRIPPEIDQKLYELEILFDRDGSLTRAKNLMTKIFRRPERVEIRSETYLVEADAYLSRARTAFNREDYQSSKLNLIRSFWSLMKILIEIGGGLVIGSRFMKNLEESSMNLDMYDIYEKYVDLMGFSELTKSDVELRLNLISSVWNEVINFVTANPPPKTMHPKMSANINYYGKEDFLNGLVARTNALIDEGSLLDAAHYMFHTLSSMLENYVYLVSVIEGTRFDYSTLFRHMKESKKFPIGVYRESLKALGVEDVSSQEAEESLKEVMEIAMNVRQRRKDLIAQFLG